jgi:hypothetical protein
LPYSAYIFLTLKLIDPEECGKVLTELMTNDETELIARLLNYNGTDSTNGPYCKFSSQDWDGLIDIPMLEKKIGYVLATTELHNIPTEILAVYRSVLDGKRYYLNGVERDDW